MIRNGWALVALCALPAAVYSQETVTTASVTGRVLDPSGAVIGGATVSALEVATGQATRVLTDAQGRFRLGFLRPGTYRISVQPTGFAERVQVVQLLAGSAFAVTMQVAVSAAQSSVIVTAPVVEADRSQISETVLPAEIANLPYNGRNAFDLALLTPGVSPTNTNSVQTYAETSPVVGQGYSVNSQRNFSNSFVVDGLSANDDAAGLAGNFYGLDVVQEFQVVTSGGQAEFGRALGGFFNIVTRSGSNVTRGTVYGLLKNQRLNASNPLAGTTLPLTQGEFGASLSGPVRRNRTFLFGNYEGRRLNTQGVVTIRPADAAAINLRLDAVGYSGPRLHVADGPVTLYPTTGHTDTAFVRGDRRSSDRDQMMARYSFYRLNSVDARGVGGINDVSYGTALRDENHTVAFGNVATLSPAVANETRAEFTYDSLQAPPNSDSPVVFIAGVATFGRFSTSPVARQNYLAEGVDNLVVQHAAHTVKVGADFLFNDVTITFPQMIRGSYTFASLAAFQAGVYNVGGYSQSFGVPVVGIRNPNVGVYLQDEWKARPGLTVNAGVRYDLQFLRTVQTDTNNVSPRVGFAWSPYADQRTVVRGSFGLFFDRIPLRALGNALLSAGNSTDPARAQLLSYTYSPGMAGAPVFPQVASAPPPGALINYALLDPHVHNAYAEQASVAVEQQLARALTVGVSYQHVRGVDLLSLRNININPDGTRPDPTRGNIKPYGSTFDSYYDGLGVSVLERPVAWGSARISYTWSKAIDNVGEFFFSAPLNNFDLSVDRSRSDDDQRHRVVFDASLNSPVSPGRGSVGRTTHGWRLGGVLQYYSRPPFNILTGASTLQQTAARPCAPAFYGSVACAEGVKGTVIGRNAGVGFDFFSMSARLSRTFALSDRLMLETTAQAFNALNHRNDAVPNGTFGTGRFNLLPLNAGFGQATAVNDPRNVEVGARLSF